MSEDLSKWEFKNELLAMAESCIGNKKETARKKGRSLFDKYQKIISYSVENADYYEKEYRKTHRILMCVKSGFINYKGGALKILDVEFYNETDTNIIVSMKSGEKVSLSKDFDFIHEIFK